MKNEVRDFIDCLNDASQLLDEHSHLDYSRIDPGLDAPSPERFSLARFEQWSEFFETTAQRNPPIRIMQHLSCTGGTLIAKCVAGLPNVAVLSEVNPLSKLKASVSRGFSPTDLSFQAMQSRLPFLDELKESIFKAEIKIIAEHLKSLGKHLVIREHSHSDFLVGESPAGTSTVRRLLEDDYPLRTVVTVRHPADSYLSMLNNGWLQFIPKTFDEYCRRYLLFIEDNGEVPIYKYEDFVVAPQLETRKISETLDLPFDESFQDLFDLMALSGDSGRTSKIISTRERREFGEDFRQEVDASEHYRRLCLVLDYARSLDSSAAAAGIEG
jgi:hypothetical protein